MIFWSCFFSLTRLSPLNLVIGSINTVECHIHELVIYTMLRQLSISGHRDMLDGSQTSKAARHCILADVGMRHAVLLQEIKLPNEQLLEFLLLDQTLAGLMHHIVDPPNEELEGDAKFNIPSAACEVLCCEVGDPNISQGLTDLQSPRLCTAYSRILRCYKLFKKSRDDAQSLNWP